jgi:hypothetical protein
MALACALVALDAQGICAQSADDATRAASARTLFQEGVQFAELGSWTLAEDRFRRALSLRASPVLAYNLASALVEQGKLVEAFEVLSRASFDEGAGTDLQTAANGLRDKLARRIGHVTVSVVGHEPDDRVLLDNHVLFRAQLGTPVVADPGRHQLRLERRGQTLTQKPFVLSDGERRFVELNGVAVAEAARPAHRGRTVEPVVASSLDADNDAHAARESRPAITSRWWFWTGAALLVVAGVGVGVAASSGGSPRTEQPFLGNVPPGSVTLAVKP